MPLDRLLDQAVEGGDRVGEDRRAGRERPPARALEAPGAVNAAASAELLRQLLMPGGEQIDGKGPGLA